MNKRRKIALLSVYKDPNYGSMLQAYALHMVLNRMGFPNEYINFRSYKRKPYIIQVCINCIRTILNLIRPSKSYWDTIYFKRQHQIFDKFQNKYIPDSAIEYDSSNIQLANACYSMFIVGSDQMWSPFVTALPNSINFLDFVEEPNIKISYAPSIGTTHISDKYLELLKKKLQSFKGISCREFANTILLSRTLNRQVKYVLDPTLLLDVQDWANIFEQISMPTNYILCYILGCKECVSEYAEKLGKNSNIPVYYIVTQPIYLAKKNALRYISVGQFLYLIKNAKYVITDSFHGSIFSINFGVNFYSFAKRPSSMKMNDNDRILDFLNQIGLADRFKEDGDKAYNNDIDYINVRKKLNELRTESMSYLNDIIS